ncbi:MAG: FliG C-terminal domain-containing protein [Pseudobdellovibrionaceae bacterium]
MSMLDRYRKKNGFAQLLQLLEGSHSQKREQFLNLIREESIIWEAELRKRVLTFDRLTKWNPQYLSEIFTRVQPLTLAVAYYEYQPELMKSALSQLSPTLIKKIEMTQSEVKPTPANRFTCQIKIVEEARALFSRGTLQLVKVDEELFIPNQIEEIIAQKEIEEAFSNRTEQVSSIVEVGAPSEAPLANDRNVTVAKPVVEETPKKIESSEVETPLEIDPKKLSSEIFIKQINQEITSLKKRVEKLSNENQHLSDESQTLRNHEVKLRDELGLLRREMQTIKKENVSMRSKLEQIKKIA